MCTYVQTTITQRVVVSKADKTNALNTSAATSVRRWLKHVRKKKRKKEKEKKREGGKNANSVVGIVDVQRVFRF